MLHFLSMVVKVLRPSDIDLLNVNDYIQNDKSDIATAECLRSYFDYHKGKRNAESTATIDHATLTSSSWVY